jgi:hypothetical protein
VLGTWRRLLESVNANREDLAHLEGSRAKLEALLARAVEVNAQQAARTAAKQEATRQLREFVIDGQRVATLLRVGIREHYGIRAEKLSEFSLQPFRGRSRKAAPAAEGPAAPDPTPTPPLEPLAAPTDPDS